MGQVLLAHPDPGEAPFGLGLNLALGVGPGLDLKIGPLNKWTMLEFSGRMLEGRPVPIWKKWDSERLASCICTHIPTS